MSRILFLGGVKVECGTSGVEQDGSQPYESSEIE